MRYYAACLTDKNEIKAATLVPPNRILLSYHFHKKSIDMIKDMIVKGVDVFIDSGAFSAKSKGVEIDIDEYCEFLHATGVVHYAALDVIGDSKATRWNQKYMEFEHSLKPIPTFHMGCKIEDVDWLLEYNYIAMGGLVFSSELRNHMDRLWNYVLKRKPNIKVHGFGMTNFEFMKRYPWYSVDSSSFKSFKRFPTTAGQPLLWGEGFNFKWFVRDEFFPLLLNMGYPEEMLEDKKAIRYVGDLLAVNSYKMYTAYLTEINKYRDFKFVTAQTNLFE